MSTTTYSAHDAGHQGNSVADKAINIAANVADAAADKIDQAKALASGLASDAAQKGREATRNVDAVASNMKGAIEKSLVEQPMTTLAVAALAGVVLGALWKS